MVDDYVGVDQAPNGIDLDQDHASKVNRPHVMEARPRCLGKEHLVCQSLPHHVIFIRLGLRGLELQPLSVLFRVDETQNSNV